MQPTENMIFRRICGHGRGWAFTANDFTHEFKRATVDGALHRLAASGTIRRVQRGVYDYPGYSDFLKQDLGPDFDQVAQAIARRFNWRIQASGDGALNLLGLSTQVPARIVYLSDGPDRSYEIEMTTLSFEHATLKDIGFKHRHSGLIVHALKALGKNHITDDVKQHIRAQLTPALRKKILADTKVVTGWVQNIILEICSEAR